MRNYKLQCSDKKYMDRQEVKKSKNSRQEVNNKEPEVKIG